MSQSTYKDGISAGVPANIIVSQKYGEEIDTDSRAQQLQEQSYTIAELFMQKIILTQYVL